MPVFELDQRMVFPNPDWAEESGLLAVGGDLNPERLVLAYANGIFPWPHARMPLLWFSPDPRMVLFPNQLTIGRRLKRTMDKKHFKLALDQKCPAVISACRTMARKDGPGTWITREMERAYVRLYKMGLVHSAEAFCNGELVGGLYGVALGGVFTGESMFTQKSDAAKIAFVALVLQLTRWNFDLIDVQIESEHMARFGARPIPRAQFLKQLEQSLQKTTRFGPWRLDDDLQ